MDNILLWNEEEGSSTTQSAREYNELWKSKFKKSENLQYNMLGRWDERLIDEASDVPSIIFFIISYRLRARAKGDFLSEKFGQFFHLP